MQDSTADPNFSFAMPIQKHPWKTIATKRQRSPNSGLLSMSHNNKQMKITNYWLGDPEEVVTTNRFSALENDVVQPPIQEIIIRPPPIMLMGVKKIAPLIEQLDIVAKNGYQTKTSAENVTIHSQSKEVYLAITKMLKEKNTMFHSFPFKDERAFRVVLKNVHHTLDTNELKTALKEKGHDVRNIHNILNRQTKRPLPLFFVDLEPKANNRDIYLIELLCNMRLCFEPPRKRREIAQCMKCQRYGHTKHYCHHQARCVKCAEFHETSACKRTTRDRNVLCVLCDGNHAANYKGCVIYKELQKKRFPPLRNDDNENADNKSPSTSGHSPKVRPGVSYAQTARENSHQQQFVNSLNQPQNSQPSNDIFELKQMMKSLMEQMGTMLNLLTTIVTKIN